jgi:pSer/pThr/pTyr-binding forkhead associated (FHA) protein
MPSLDLITNDGRRSTFQIDTGKITIGRSNDNNVILSDRTVSRHHAQITKTKLGYLVTDLQSSNGTRVNEKPIQRTLLKHNDKIRIGGSSLIFLTEKEQEPPPENSLILTTDDDYEGENRHILKSLSEGGAIDSQELPVSVEDRELKEAAIAPTPEKTQAELERKNEAPRIQVRWPITVLTDEDRIEGETRTITAAGMFIRCKEPLRVNATYRISIRPPNRQAIELTCKLIWSSLYDIDGQDTAYAMGFHFVKVSDEDRHLLSDMVSAHYEY